MAWYDSNIPDQCITYTKHCASSGDNDVCCFCGISTKNFTKADWNKDCPNANAPITHNYQIEAMYGMAVREQDYVQVVHYRCTNCNHKYVERDDQR